MTFEEWLQEYQGALEVRIRTQALQALAQLEDARVPEVLVQAAGDDDARVRGFVPYCMALRRYDERVIWEAEAAAYMDALLTLLDDPDITVRVMAFNTLGDIGDGRALRPLALRLGDATPVTLPQGQLTLGQLARQALQRLGFDPDQLAQA